MITGIYDEKSREFAPGWLERIISSRKDAVLILENAQRKPAGKGKRQVAQIKDLVKLADIDGQWHPARYVDADKESRYDRFYDVYVVASLYLYHDELIKLKQVKKDPEKYRRKSVNKKPADGRIKQLRLRNRVDKPEIVLSYQDIEYEKIQKGSGFVLRPKGVKPDGLTPYERSQALKTKKESSPTTLDLLVIHNRLKSYQRLFDIPDFELQCEHCEVCEDEWLPGLTQACYYVGCDGVRGILDAHEKLYGSPYDGHFKRFVKSVYEYTSKAPQKGRKKTHT